MTARRERAMFEAKSFAHSAAALRAKLAALRLDAEPEPAPLSFAWCSPPPRVSAEVLRDALATVAPGCSVAVLLRDGRVLVGGVASASPLIVRLWGRARPTRIPASAVRSVMVTGQHTHAEAAEVRARQARGEPALLSGDSAQLVQRSRFGAGRIDLGQAAHFPSTPIRSTLSKWPGGAPTPRAVADNLNRRSST